MLQTGEIVIIAILALVVLGPKRLPEMARKVGHWISELRKAAREITAGLEAEVSGLKEVRKELTTPIEEVKKPFTEIRDEVKGLGGEKNKKKRRKPVSGPTPEDAMRDLEQMEAEKAESEKEQTPAAENESDE